MTATMIEVQLMLPLSYCTTRNLNLNSHYCSANREIIAPTVSNKVHTLIELCMVAGKWKFWTSKVFVLVSALSGWNYLPFGGLLSTNIARNCRILRWMTCKREGVSPRRPETSFCLAAECWADKCTWISLEITVFRIGTTRQFNQLNRERELGLVGGGGTGNSNWTS